MTRCFLLYIFLLLINGPASAQYKLLARIDIPAKSISIDNLDNIYLLSEKNELLKFNPEGVLQSSYSNKNLGADFSLDVSDPLRIVLFSPSFQQFVLLNQHLAEISAYRFRDISRNITLLSATADSKGFWVYDENSFQLHKLTKDLGDEHLSGNISQISGMRLHPKLLQADGQYVYLYDPQNGLLQFDRFGAFIKTFPLKGYYPVQIKNSRLIYVEGKELKTMDLLTGETSAKEVPKLPLVIKQALIGSKTMAFLSPEWLYIFAQ